MPGRGQAVGYAVVIPAHDPARSGGILRPAPKAFSQWVKAGRGADVVRSVTVTLELGTVPDLDKATIVKAVVVDRSGPPEVLALREVDSPRPTGRHVLVRVRAWGVCRRDILTRQRSAWADLPAQVVCR